MTAVARIYRNRPPADMPYLAGYGIEWRGPNGWRKTRRIYPTVRDAMALAYRCGAKGIELGPGVNPNDDENQST